MRPGHGGGGGSDHETGMTAGGGVYCARQERTKNQRVKGVFLLQHARGQCVGGIVL